MDRQSNDRLGRDSCSENRLRHGHRREILCAVRRLANAYSKSYTYSNPCTYSDTDAVHGEMHTHA